MRRKVFGKNLCLPGQFEIGMVSGLPEPARRFLEFAIRPGTRLTTVVEITMVGQLSLGTKDDPKYQPARTGLGYITA